MPDPGGSSEPFGGEVLEGPFLVDDELEDCELPLSCPLVTMRGDNQDSTRRRGLLEYSIKVGSAGVPTTRVGTPAPRWLLVASFVASGVTPYSEGQTPPKKE